MKYILFPIRYIIYSLLISSYLFYRQFWASLLYIIARKRIPQWLDNNVQFHGHFIITCLKILGLHYTPHDLGKILNTSWSYPTIVIANHQSFLDILALYSYLRYKKIRFILKQSVLYGIPYVSFVVRSLRLGAVDRNNPKQALPAIKQLAKRVKRSDGVIVLYPEGTRSHTGVLQSFHSGAVRTIAKQDPINIEVVALHNTYLFPTMFSAKYFSPHKLHVAHLHSYKNVHHREVATVLKDAHEKIEAQIEAWNREHQLAK